MTNYIAAIHKEKESSFSISFPDFPGCISAAKNIDQAKDMAEEALSLHIKGMLEDGEKISEPSSLEAISKMKEYRDASLFFMVSVKEEVSHKVRFNATIDENLLKKIDEVAKKLGKTRSAFLADSAREFIKHA